MTQQEKNKEFKHITDKMLELYSTKNELYGDSFNMLMHELGLVAGVVPLDNKLRRIKSIIKGTEVKYESLEDSLFDLANYAIMMLIHLIEVESAKSSDLVKHQEDTFKFSPTPVTITDSYDPCKYCTLWKTEWSSITNPCFGCPHYKGESYDVVYCSTTGGTNNE